MAIKTYNYNDNTQKPGEEYDLDIVNKRLEKNFITERILKYTQHIEKI